MIPLLRQLVMILAIGSHLAHADPRLTQWMTAGSSRYARITETTTTTPVAVWPSSGIPKNAQSPSQTIPAYADVQQILYSANFVYVRSADLASHQMGPWYKEYSKTTVNGLWPARRSLTSKIPRFPTPVALPNQVADQVRQGPVGVLVNGVTIANLGDGQGYDTALGRDAGVNSGGIPGNTSDVWIRNATGAEGPILDSGFGHPAPDGGYHYHANPRALRHQLGDNLTYVATVNPLTGVRSETYTENTTQLHHSPILGWAYDGYPIYGPYGYSQALNATTPVRRMVSGHVLRDGSYGTTNLTITGRHSLAPWAALFHTFTTTLATVDFQLTPGPSGNYGPDVSTAFPLGWYAEDFDYLGDRIKIPSSAQYYQQGVDFDLDKSNGRTCVTPEFPSGTYAYFIPVNESGVPAFPYSIGRYWHGNVTGGRVLNGNINETVSTLFTGGPATKETAQAPTVDATGNVTIIWSSVEGSSYKVEASNDLSSIWTTVRATTPAASFAVRTSITDPGAALNWSRRFYRISRIALAPYDPAYIGQ